MMIGRMFTIGLDQTVRFPPQRSLLHIQDMHEMAAVSVSPKPSDESTGSILNPLVL